MKRLFPVPNKKSVLAIFFAIIFCVICPLFFLTSVKAAAGINKIINFQGKVVNSDGTNVTDGTYDFAVKMYDGPGSAASNTYTETWSSAALFSSTISSLTVTTSVDGNVVYQVGASNDSTLQVGQILTNTTKGESVYITSINTGTRTIGVSATLATWQTGDTITNKIYVKNGIFRIAIGSLTAISGPNFNTTNVYLGVNFNRDGEMKPRIQYAAVPYAFNADQLQGGTWAAPGTAIGSGTPVAGTFTSLTANTTGDALTLSGSGANINFSGSGLAQIKTASNQNFALMPGGTGNIGIGITTPIGLLDVEGATMGKALAVLNYTGTDQNIFVASKSGTTQFTIGNSGNIGFAGNTSFMNTLVSAATAAQTYTFPDATGIVCLSTNNCSFALGTNYWQLNAGALSPFSNTADLLIGGTATNSANFAFINNASGTPTASISGNLVLNSLGIVQTTKNQTLTIGGNTTGNITLSPLNGTGVAILNGALRLTQGASATDTFVTPLGTNVQTKINIPLYDPGAFGQLIAIGLPSSANSTSRGITLSDARASTHQPTLAVLSPDENQIAGLSWEGTNNSFYIKNSVAGGNIDFSFNGSNAAAISPNLGALLYQGYGPTSGNVGATNNLAIGAGGSSPNAASIAWGDGTGWKLNFGNTGSGSFTPKITFLDNGSIGIGTTTPSGLLNVSGRTTGQALAQVNETGDQALFTASASGTTKFVIDHSGNVGIGITTPVGLFDAEGAITGKALAIFNYTSSGQNILTASASGTTKFTLDGSGNLSLAAGAVIDTLTAGGLSFGTANANAITIGKSGVTTSVNGPLTIASGQNVTLTGFGNNGGVLYTNGSGVVAQTVVGGNGQCLQSIGGGAPTWGTCGSGGGGTNYWQLNAGVLSPFSNTADLLVGGTSSPSAKFAFMNVNSGTPTASISGNLSIGITSGNSQAGLFNILNGGSLNFQTSTSGQGDAGLSSRLFIKNDGNIGIGTTNPTSTLFVSPSVTASSGIAQGVTISGGTLTAAANSDSLRTFHINSMTYATGTFTGLGAIGLDIDGSTFSKTGSGTIANAYDIYLANAPTIGTNNYSLFVNAGTSYFGGNVGVGTTNPGSPLTVSATTAFTTGTVASVVAPASTLTGALTGLNVNVSGTTPGTNNVLGISTTAFTGGGNGTTNIGVKVGNVTGSGTSTNYGLQIGTVSGGSTNYSLNFTGGSNINDAAGKLQMIAGGTGTGASGTGSIYFLDNSGNVQTRVDTTTSALSTTGNGADGAITVSTSKNINTTAIETGRPTCLSATACADGIAYKIDMTQSAGLLPNTGNTQILTVDTPTGIAANDQVLLINLQGATGDTGSVGNYEFLKVSSVSTKTITFTTAIANNYKGTTATNQKVVIQRIPQYTNVTVSSGGTITASAYDDLATTPANGAGYLTGIVAFRASGIVNVQSGGTIKADGLGYAGGTGGLGSAANGGNSGESFDGKVGRGGSGASGGESNGGGRAGDGATTSPNDGTARGGGGGGGSAGSVPGGDEGGGGGGGGSYGSAAGGGGGGDDCGGLSAFGAGGASSTSLNGGGGGAGAAGCFVGAGNGGNANSAGGNSTVGAVGGQVGSGATGASGGAGGGGTGVGGGGGGGGGTYGSANLTTMSYGSGGGGGGSNSSGTSAGQAGGTGGGMVFVAGTTVTVAGTLSSNGASGTNAGGLGGAGGSGAGGSVYLLAANLTVGTNLVNATGGAVVGSSGARGGGGAAGGNGIIRVDYENVSGITSPTASVNVITLNGSVYTENIQPINTSLNLGQSGTSTGVTSVNGGTIEIGTSGTTITNIGSASDTLALSSGGSSTWALAPSTTALNFDSNTLNIDSTNHRVGIGTTTPAQKLDINGNLNFSNATSNTIFYGGNGAAVPGFGSVGEKIQLWGTAGTVNTTDYALGIESNNMWFNTASGYKWYSNASLKMLVDGSGNVGIGVTAPTALLDTEGGPAGKALVALNYTGTDQNILVASSSGTNRLTIANNGDVTYSSTETTGTANILNANSVTTGTGLAVNLNAFTGGATSYGLNLSSTSTAWTGAGALGYMNWNPGSATTSTGDLLALNVGANATIGNIFNVQNNGSSVFSVSQTQLTSSLPVNFTAPGDGSFSYDINFTNPSGSYIKSQAPLYLQSGEVFNSSDLTLRTFNVGNVIADTQAFQTTGSASIAAQLVVGTTTPTSNLIGGMYLTNASTYGKALAILNQTESADIFTASSSGTAKFVIQNSGNVGIGISNPIVKLSASDSQTATSSAYLENIAAMSGSASRTCKNACHGGLTIKLGAANSATNPGFNDSFLTFLRGDGAVMGYIRGTNSTGVLTVNNGLDYAEYFKKEVPDANILAGTLMCLNKNGHAEACTNSVGPMIGIVSDNPSAIGAGGHDGDPTYVMIGLVGQVPLQVSSANGPIQPGDFLTASDAPGVAVKAVKAGQVVGKAMESYTNTNQSAIGTVMTNVQASWYDPQISLNATGDLVRNDTTQNVSFNAVQAQSFSALNLSANTITAGLSITTKEMSAEQLFTNAITASSGADLILGFDQNHKVIIQGSNVSSPAVTIDSQGNATFAGIITAKGIKADQIEGLDIIQSGIRDQELQIASLSALIASLSTKQQVLSASDSGEARMIENVIASTSAVEIATPSALLFDTSVLGISTSSADLLTDGLTMQNATVSGNLRVKGNGFVEGLLNVIDTLTTHNLIVSGVSDFFDKVMFHSDVTIAGHTAVSNDTAGIVTLKKGQTSITVSFQQAYETRPVVNATLTVSPVTLSNGKEEDPTITAKRILNASYGFVISNNTPKGFTIVLNKHAVDNLQFSWTAFGVTASQIQTGFVSPMASDSAGVQE